MKRTIVYVHDDYSRYSREKKAEFLRKQARKYYQLTITPPKSPSQENFLYIISLKWLKRWEEYVSYNEYKEKKPKSDDFGKRAPGIINDDLIDDSRDSYLPHSDENSYLNVNLSDNLWQDFHFKFVNEEVWNFFKSHYSHIEIKRKCQRNSGGHLQVDLNTRKV
jgi:hypothetical protein